MKRQNTDWEKLLAKHIYDKVLANSIKKSDYSILRNPIKTWAKDFNRDFNKEDTTWQVSTGSVQYH